MKALRAGDPEQVGPYRLVGLIGSGGMGSVFLGRSRGGRTAAVKVVRPDLAEDPQFRRRFVREVTAIRRVNSAFTAGVVDADPDATPPWLATVYVPGMALSEAVATHGPWPPGPVLTLGSGLAEALGAIHAAGVVHRDLKPSNILLAHDGPRVIDFGISVVSDASALTQTGAMVGTPGFMSPEQLTGDRSSPASDVFSLGAVLAYAATGAGPFGTGSAHGLHYRTVHESPNLERLPSELRPLVDHCLAKDPAQRPTVAALMHQLSGAGAYAAPPPAHGWLPEPVAVTVQLHAPTIQSMDEPPQAAPPPSGITRRRALFGLAGVSAAAGIGYGVWRFTGTDNDTKNAGPAPRQSPTVPRRPGTPHWKSTVAVGDGRDDADGALAVANGTVYFPGRKGLYAVSADQGTERWTHTTGATDGALVPTPAVTADTVCVVVGDILRALDADTGKQKWASGELDVADAAPSAADDTVCFLGGSGTSTVLYAVSTSTGKIQLEAISTDLENADSARVADGTVYTSSQGALYAYDPAAGKRKWRHLAAAIEISAVAVAGDTVYFTIFGENGTHVSALSTGGTERWSAAAEDGGSFQGPPIVSGDTVYVCGETTLYAFHAKTGAPKWRTPFTTAIHPTPSAADGTVCVAADTTLHALHADTGKKKWDYTADEALRTGPLLSGPAAYVTGASGTLYAITV
ncbi:PQQ-binding-like beta-propeller repeat protein [Streptomyces sp. NPDC102274]|uniref:protein kinase domain-containing protein n=1 Tax=Streptomyces sp. NPDC102274 TaxID=3366151 RepID=UPI0037F9CBB7